MTLLPTVILLLLTPTTLSLPLTSPSTDLAEIAAVSPRACYSQCGSICYSSTQVTTARNWGYKFYQADSTSGGSSYPHTYSNYEGFSFMVGGPYQEFPILGSGTYNGGKWLAGGGFVFVLWLMLEFFVLGSPGPDRVIFNSRGQRAGEITHTGASGSSFVKCSGW
ncbi:Ribonuclease/ribotoxin [Decorospora gaudefroyi]|uniref:ribonuclease T1 n=1 Tax=Decorospora gaudefroyi TaxID=184978 RepID=A0A6A5KVN8_9PLEO|nr:Ribonuclease/ribotoxin [Decorospora gaudefroyi]